MDHEIAFEMAAPSIRYGADVTEEIGMDLADMAVNRVMILTDPYLRKMGPVAKVWSRSTKTRSSSGYSTGCALSPRTSRFVNHRVCSQRARAEESR